MGSPQTIAYDDLYRLTSAQVSSGKLGDYGPESYAYDPLNRLTNAAYSTGEQFEYSYDAVGNRVSQTNPGGTIEYLYDEANQLISANGISYTWDANGNLLSDGTYTYEYDYANRLASAIGQGDVYGFAYNGLGNRYQQTVNGETSTYTLDLAASLPQVISDGTYTYLYGANRFAQQSTIRTDYFLTDGLGSVRQLADSNGYISLEQTFDPFGGLLNQSGTNASHYGFAGEWTDATGLQHLRARYYAPSQGRFMSRDPFPGMMGMPATLHPYVYALNNPVLYTDPSGEFAFIPLIIAAVAGGVLGGVGYYGLEQHLSEDVCAEWNWYEAALWGGAGAVLGAAVGSVFYGGWWAGVQLGWWGTAFDAINNQLTNISSSISAPLTNTQKLAYRNSVYDPFFRAYPRLGKFIGTGKLEIHHRIPLEWSHLLPRVDPNRITNLYALPRTIHRGLVNPYWAFFRSSNPIPTLSEVMKFTIQIDRIIAQYINRIPK